MTLSAIKKPPILIAAGVIVVVCLVQLIRHDFVERMERITYDWRVRQAARFSFSGVATNLGFVAITDDSIARINDTSLGFNYGLYWPRHLYGRVVRELRYEGARVEAFDILFAELRPDHGILAMENPPVSSDEYFAIQMKAAGNVLIAADGGVLPDRLFNQNVLALGDITAEYDPDGTMRRARAFRMYKKWHRAFRALHKDTDLRIDLDKAKILPTEIVLVRPKPKSKDSRETDKEREIHIPLDKDGNFDVATIFGTNLPTGMARYDKPYTEERVWHMGIMLAAQQLGLDLTNAKVELNKGRITLSGPNGVKRVIPVDAEGTFYINWCIPIEDSRLTAEPFEALLARDQARATDDTNRFAEYMNAADWRNKLVVIGSTATGNDLSDRGATPLDKNTFLVSEHWNVANSIITGKFVTKSSLPMELFLISAMGVLAAWLTWRTRSWTSSLWIVCALAGYVLVTLLAYILFLYWMPMILPMVGGMLATHGCLLGYLVIFEQAERRRVRNVFTKVVAPDVVTELLQYDNKLSSLNGARRKITVFFSDIRGFTEMTDVSRDHAAEYIREHNLTGDAAEAIYDKQAQETLNTVNEYLSVIADIVRKNGGTVDKFIGDCVMAFWGAPISNIHHALSCVRAAIEVQRTIHRMNQERMAENRQREAHNLLLAAEGKALQPLLPILVVGTGINTGVVTVGLMGSKDQLNYTVFGREVNLASRLEGVSGRSRIIISEATLAEIIQDDATLALSCKALPPEPVKGIREPVPIFEVPWREGAGMEDAAQSAQKEAFNTGYFTAGERIAES